MTEPTDLSGVRSAAFSDVIEDLQLLNFSKQAKAEALLSLISVEGRPPLNLREFRKLLRTTLLFETEAIDFSQHDQEASKFWESAYFGWCRIYAALSDSSEITPSFLSEIKNICGDVFVQVKNGAEMFCLLHLAATGLLAGKLADVRTILRDVEISQHTDGHWKSRLIQNTISGFLCLVRKDNGWTDVALANKTIQLLKEDQQKFEEDYLNTVEGREAQTQSALSLVGLYHAAHCVTVTGEYLETGANGRDKTLTTINRHERRAKSAFNAASASELSRWVQLLFKGLITVIDNSLWSHVRGLSEEIDAFADSLSKGGSPIVELWPSQQQALKSRLLDPYSKAVSVQMPTSGGKTLLAKFSIIQSLALFPDRTVVYIVPTRALVNQVTLDLREDLAPLNHNVEQAVPAFEIDPSERQLLSADINVLVVTPEKFDLLIRSEHPVVEKVSLVVVDEAHNIADKSRGIRLELLLAILKRERPDARFLLLSPFLPNGKTLLNWLGADRGSVPIQIDWQPSEKLVGTIKLEGRAKNRGIWLSTLPNASQLFSKKDYKVKLTNRDKLVGGNTVTGLSRSYVKELVESERRTTLVLCRGKATATKRAIQLSEDLPDREPSDFMNSTIDFLRADEGFDVPLANCLKKGVAYHHAGMSPEAKVLVEALVKRGEVKVVCGTTTLAQGVNFPISTVIVEDLRKGQFDKLNYTDFWNIAGRAGRALVDRMGVVVRPVTNTKQAEEFKDFLRGEAEEIASQMATIVAASNNLGYQLNLKNIRQVPGLSAMLQYLAHVVRVSENSDLADEIEDILASSLMQQQRDKVDGDLFDRFLDVCRAYVRSVSAQKSGLLSIADKTGFSTPSVNYLLAKGATSGDVVDPVTWEPSNLFGADIRHLQSRIEMIADIPEMNLGDGQGQPLNTERVASILRDWVNGEDAYSLCNKYGHNPAALENIGTRDKTIADFSAYLYSKLTSNASWGLGALEGLSLANSTVEENNDAEYVPSMIFFGVDTKEAVWMRMIGVPRIVAKQLGALWNEQKRGMPKSYSNLREWLGQLENRHWEQVTTTRHPLTHKNIRFLTEFLVGRK